MRIEFVFDTYDIGMWFRSRWTRLLIRLHLRKPYDGPNWVQMFDKPISFSSMLYDISPSDVPYNEFFKESPIILLQKAKLTGELGLADSGFKGSVTDLSDEDG